MRYETGTATYRNLATGAVAARNVGQVLIAPERIVVEDILFGDWIDPYRYTIDRRSGDGRWTSATRSGPLRQCSWNEEAKTLTGVHVERQDGPDSFTLDVD